MRQPRVPVLLVYRIFGIVALIGALFSAGCGSSGNHAAAPNLSGSVSPSGVFASGQVGASYSITVSNAAGAGTTSGTVTVTDPPTGFTVTAIGGAGWTCTLATLTCTRSDALAGGQSYPAIVVTGNVTASNGSSVSIPVSISGGGLTNTVSGTPTILVGVTISTLNPTSGPVGTSVTITGTNFGSAQSTSTVTFNGTSAGTASAWSATSITVTVPSGATTGNVVVTVGGVASNGMSFTVLLTPAISNLNPTSGVIGASVIVTGTNFGATQGTSTVTFNGTSAGTASAWSATSITVNVPSGATTGNVVVTVNGVSSAGSPFTVGPVISSLSRTSGAVGASVTITGTNFGAPQGSSTVTFNGTSAGTASAWSATSITVNVPSGATTGNVVVTVGTLQSNGVNFTVVIPPNISSLSETQGYIGDSVTITGTNFGAPQGSSTVTFNGTSAGTASAWSATSITVNVPTGATTGNVVVTVSGTSSNNVNFTVAPVISNLSPNSGGVASTVVITGTNFGSPQGTSTVTFNGTSAGTASAWSATSITVNVPSGSTTGNVVVTVGTLASTGTNTFTVTPAPVITSLSSTSGAIGTSITINGANFGSSQGSSTVVFNNTTATPSVWTATAITVPVPTGASTGNVVVTVGGLASNGEDFFVTVSCPLPTKGNESLLSGSYVISFDGFGDSDGPLSASAPLQMTGVFTANGSGTISAGEVDGGNVYSNTSPQVQEQTVTSGCYNLGSDQRGLLILNLSGVSSDTPPIPAGPITFAFSVRNDGTLGRLIEFDDFNPSTNPGSRGSGIFKKQTLTSFSSSDFSGAYALGLTGANNDTNGSTANYQRIGVVGVLTAGGSALTITNGVLDVAQVTSNAQQNVDSIPIVSASSSFTAPDSKGRGTLTATLNSMTLCGGTCTASFSYYLVGTGDVFLQGLGGSDNPMFNGEALKQSGTFNAGILSGDAIFTATGEDIINHTYTVLAAGQVSSNGSGSASVYLDKESNGTVLNTGTTQITGGSFSVSSNGMGVLTIGSGGSAQPFDVAMVGQNTGFVLEGTQSSPGTNIMTGLLEPQTVTTTLATTHPFSLASAYPATTNASVQVGSLSGASPNFTGTQDQSSGFSCSTGCLNSDQPLAGTYAIDSHGRITVTVTTGGGGSAVGWLLDSTDFTAITSDSNAAFLVFNQ